MAEFRIFATCDIGEEALQRLRAKGWDLEVYGKVDPPPRELLLKKVKRGIDALITTVRDGIDDELLAAGRVAGLKIVAQDGVSETHWPPKMAARTRTNPKMDVSRTFPGRMRRR